MADYQAWTVYFQNVPNGNGKNMAAMLNQSASKVLKVWRIGYCNNSIDAGVATATLIELQRYTQATLTFSSQSTMVVPVSNDKYNEAPTEVVYGAEATPAGTSEVLRRVTRSTEKQVVYNSVGQWNYLNAIVEWNIIFDAGYLDDNVQPLTLRQNEMVLLWQTGAVGASTLDSWFEFTVE